MTGKHLKVSTRSFRAMSYKNIALCSRDSPCSATVCRSRPQPASMQIPLPQPFNPCTPRQLSQLSYRMNYVCRAFGWQSASHNNCCTHVPCDGGMYAAPPIPHPISRACHVCTTPTYARAATCIMQSGRSDYSIVGSRPLSQAQMPLSLSAAACSRCSAAIGCCKTHEACGQLAST